jgi:hypothetical protein
MVLGFRVQRLRFRVKVYDWRFRAQNLKLRV